MKKDDKEIYFTLLNQLNVIHNTIHLMKESLYKHFLSKEDEVKDSESNQ